MSCRQSIARRWLPAAGLPAWSMEAASIDSVGLCIGRWIRAKTIDQGERGNPERRAMFVDLWPPTIWLIGDSLAGHEARPPVRVRRGVRR